MKVQDTPENLEICKRFCGPCPTFQENKLMEVEPHALFCARGPSKKTDCISKGCNCPNCEVAKKYGLTGGWFCLHPPKED